MGKGLYKRLNALRFLIIFFMYLFILDEGRGGGCTNACICIGTHSQPLLQNRLMDVYETWYRDEVIMAPHLWLDFSANPAKGWIQGGAKIG